MCLSSFLPSFIKSSRVSFKAVIHFNWDDVNIISVHHNIFLLSSHPQTGCSYLGWFSVWHLAVLGEVEVLMSLKQRSRGVPSVLSLSSIPPSLWGTSECPRRELLTPELPHPWHTHILSLGSLKRLVNMASICFATIKLFRTNSCWWLLEEATLCALWSLHFGYWCKLFHVWWNNLLPV